MRDAMIVIDGWPLGVYSPAMSDLVQYCAMWLHAWTGNNPEGLLRFYAVDAFYRDPARPDGLRGHSQLLPYFAKLLGKNPDWVWRSREVLPIAKGFTLKWYAQIPVSTEIVGIEGLDIVEVEADKITRNEVYFDTAPLVRASHVQKQR
jgi:hypothetical protein